MRCRLVLPLFCQWCPAGRRAFLVAGFHCLPLAFLPPIPPPALAERSSPALNPRGTGVGASHLCGGGLPLPRRLGVPLVLLLPPIPPPPFPAGEGGIYSYLMQGAPPLASPGLEPGRHWFVPRWRLLKRRFLLNPRGTGGGANHVCGGGGVLSCLRCHCLPLAFLPLSPRPRSQSALPRRGRGRFLVYFAGGSAPRRSPLPLMRWRLLKGHFPWVRAQTPSQNRFIREKFWGVWGTLSRVPQRFPRSPRLSRFPRFRDSQGLFLENILLF